MSCPRVSCTLGMVMIDICKLQILKRVARVVSVCERYLLNRTSVCDITL